MKADTLTVLAADLLDACADAYGEVAGAGVPPDRRYISHGQPLHSADQLTVHWTFLQPALVGKSAIVPQAELIVECVRWAWPLPEANVARVDDAGTVAYAEAAALIAADATAIFTHVGRLLAAGTLFVSFPTIGKGDATADRMTPIGPAGNVVGFRWPVRVKLTIP